MTHQRLQQTQTRPRRCTRPEQGPHDPVSETRDGDGRNEDLLQGDEDVKFQLSDEHDPSELSEVEKQELMAAAGDVDGLWAALTASHWSLVDHAQVFGLLLRAIDVAARQDPLKFSRDMFARMFAFSSFLLLRGQYYVASLFPSHDEFQSSRGPLSLPPQVLEQLPRLMELQQHVAALAESQARSARLWELATKQRRIPDSLEGGQNADADKPQREAPALGYDRGGAPSGAGDRPHREMLRNGASVNGTVKEEGHDDDTAGGESLRLERPMAASRGGLPAERTPPHPAGFDRGQARPREEEVGAPVRHPARR